MDLLSGSVPLESADETLDGLDALEALLNHLPIQRVCEGHDGVLLFTPSLEWWNLGFLTCNEWRRTTDPVHLQGATTLEECKKVLRIWWAYGGNQMYKWTLYRGATP
jgi:hypothetical protein